LAWPCIQGENSDSWRDKRRETIQNSFPKSSTILDTYR